MAYVNSKNGKSKQVAVM